MSAQRPGPEAVPWTKTTGIRPRRYGCMNRSCARASPCLVATTRPFSKIADQETAQFPVPNGGFTQRIGKSSRWLNLQGNALLVDFDKISCITVVDLKGGGDTARRQRPTGIIETKESGHRYLGTAANEVTYLGVGRKSHRARR